ncbi:hypothetical protein [Bradyrhizobium sp. SZCCHNR1039]|uniref:hypothetical protein n=1 Tax=Bradyrhizobium sp. SZCCHNR1039 TaxID=3057350 RepID=UPI002915C8E8|nr:hypothetical protein [Bradyrhizobium sp. SZCCHNR1039]
MLDRKFPVLGTSVPPMLGRELIMGRMLAALTKANPDHLQMVGPRYSGKTVILHELARRLKSANNTPYTAVLLWDLGHQTPATDELFMQRLAGELSVALLDKHADYAEHLKKPRDNAYQDVAEVLDAIKEEGGKVLAILDGFDKPLSNGRLTRNLWDQLRELALKPSLRLVTASRRTLRDLIRNPESQTSDFWGIFDPSPVRVGCFGENDLAALLAQVPQLHLTGGAQTELWNASNGYPVMMLEALNCLCEEVSEGTVTPEVMKSSCGSAYPRLRDKIDSLWRDCSPQCQDLLFRVMEEGAVLRTGSIGADAEILVDRGFVRLTGNKVQGVSRLLERYLEEQPNENSALLRMFGDVGSYNNNLKGALEHRLGQIEDLDGVLKKYLQQGLGDFPEHPGVFLSSVHGILEQALTLIWKAECWDSKKNRAWIRGEWFSLWQRNEERVPEEWKTRFPEGGQRLRLLDLMTGTQKSDRLARFVTKNTYVLANALQGFRDFGVHPKSAEVDLGTSYAALHLCIELASLLAREVSETN